MHCPCIEDWNVWFWYSGTSWRHQDKCWCVRDEGTHRWWGIMMLIGRISSRQRSMSRYCIFVGGNLISSKRRTWLLILVQGTKSWSVIHVHFLGLNNLFKRWGLEIINQWKLCYNYKTTLHIASNPVFHERTKYVKVNCHFIREKIISITIETEFVSSDNC